MITTKTKLCMVIGDPVEHSLSPAMHNAGYKSIGIDSEFVYIAARITSDRLRDFVQGARAIGIRGISCTIPHKEEIMKYLDEVDETAKKICAVNTVVNNNGILKGFNTDYLGAVNALKQKTSIKGKKVALIGAGGAARAIAFGITKEGGSLTIFNRTKEKATALAKEFGGSAEGLDVLKYGGVKLSHSWGGRDTTDTTMDIVINSTSVGMGDESKTLVPKEFLQKNQVVMDAVYRPHQTRLLLDAKEKGASVIYGIEMLLYQGVAQFELYTGQKAPVDVMRKALEKHI